MSYFPKFNSFKALIINVLNKMCITLTYGRQLDAEKRSYSRSVWRYLGKPEALVQTLFYVCTSPYLFRFYMYQFQMLVMLLCEATHILGIRTLVQKLVSPPTESRQDQALKPPLQGEQHLLPHFISIFTNKYFINFTIYKIFKT